MLLEQRAWWVAVTTSLALLGQGATSRAAIPESTPLVVVSHAANDGSRTLEPEVLDFRYQPPQGQCCLGLVDDPFKTILGYDGGLYYGYGRSKSKGYHCGQGSFGGRFRARLDAGAAQERVSQDLLDPRTPIVTTRFRSGALELREEAWAGFDRPAGGAEAWDRRTDYLRLTVTNTAQARAGGKLILDADATTALQLGADQARVVSQRYPDRTYARFSKPCQTSPASSARATLAVAEPPSVTRNWARPTRACAASFKHVMVAQRSPLAFEFKAEKGERYQVGFGLIEGWHTAAGKRVLELRIEGQVARKVDMVAEFGRNVPAVFVFPAEDRDGDGLIDVVIECLAESADRNTVLSALWIFPAERAPMAEQLLAGQYDAKQAVALADADHLPAAPRPLTLEWEIKPLAPAEQFELFVTLPQGARARREGELPDAAQAKSQAVEYWKKAPLPYNRLTVGDPTVQALLDSCIRNIYQAREVKNELPAFQVGPTAYRGLWVVDGAFLLEAVTLLGRWEEARRGIEYLLSFQRPDGGFMLLDHHWKETGIVVWAVTRHAQLTGDRDWLASVWPRLEQGRAFIRQMRAEAASDPAAPSRQLIPPGASDGGLGGIEHEYTNVYWTMVGLKAGADAARWLGRADDARAWQADYEDLAAAFRVAMQRDLRDDGRGNRVLPIRMQPQADVPPQKAQWAFLHAVHPGQLFASDDPLVRGNMAMLQACERQGLVCDTGWLAGGNWTYFGSFYGHAWLWLGDGAKAASTLYAFGNHASPLLCWREEQALGGAKPGYVGDMPHNWASAEFVRLAAHLLVFERGETLHLLEGLPRKWTAPGARNEVCGMPTVFGTIGLDLAIAADGRSARLRIRRPVRTPPRQIVLHLERFDSPVQTVLLEGRSVQDSSVALSAPLTTLDLVLRPAKP